MAMNWQQPVVDVQRTVRSMAGTIVRIPVSAFLVVGLIELVATFAGRLTLLVFAGLIISVVLVALAEAYLTAVVLGPADEPPARVAEVAIARLTNVLGFLLLEGIAVGLAAIPVVLVGLLTLYHPAVVRGSPIAPFPSAGVVLLIGTVDLVGAPLFGRWLCALPLMVDRRLGTRAAMGSSWDAVRGSTLRCALLWLVAELPVLVTLASPSAVRLPLTFLDACVTILLQTALSVAVYRQLFASIVRAYPITDEGRLEFEADGATLVPRGYRVSSTVDADDSREITWTR
jgi:hypothetical protein